MTDFSDMAGNGHIYIKAYSADGFQIGLTLPALTVADAMRHLEDVRAHGLLTTLPVDGGLESGESAETITMAVKRMKKNRKEETRPIIDVYWDGAGFKFVSIYLDTDEQIADFEAVSGLKVAAMPKYPSTAPLTAGDEETREFEVKVKTPFIAVRKPADKEVDINGKMVRPWHFVRYGTLATPAPAPVNAAPKAPIIPIDEHNFGHRAPDTRKPKAAAAPAETMSDVELCAYVTVKVGATGPFYRFLSSDEKVEAFMFERAPFRNQGWAVDGWLPNEDGTPAEYDLDRFPRANLKQAADGYWHVTHVTAYDMCDKYEEGATA